MHEAEPGRGFARDLQRPLERLLGEQQLGVAVEPVARGLGGVARLGHDLELTARGGEIAGNLQGIYAFCRRHLIEAWVDQDAEKIDQVSGLLGELREAWAEIAGA